MPEEVRTIEAADIDDWVKCMGVGFFYEVADGEPEFRLAEMDLRRTWAAYGRGGVVGTLRSFPSPLSVPGSTEPGSTVPGSTAARPVVPAAALTNVTVAPTHRRRGLLRRMITNDLRSAADRGEPVGILIASEYPIYGRFGYGAAAEGASYRVDTRAARFLPPVEGSVELVDLGTLRRVAPEVYERSQLAQPGAIGRSERWWDRALEQIAVPGAKPSKGYRAIYRADDGAVHGYVRYTAKDEWDDMRPNGRLTIEELVSTTPAAYQGLWQFCCEVDLVTSVQAGDRSAAEPLPWLLGDARAVRQTGRWDFLWVRMLDVCAALEARRYLTEGSVVLDVVDDMGIAGGRYSLSGGPAGANCTRTDRSADLTLPVWALGASYLGGVPMRTLGATGWVDERRAGALAIADAMFRSPVTPWCSTWF